MGGAVGVVWMQTRDDEASRSRWSARSEARTNDLDAGVERRSLFRV
jgi:hypothetical protein